MSSRQTKHQITHFEIIWGLDAVAPDALERDDDKLVISSEKKKNIFFNLKEIKKENDENLRLTDFDDRHQTFDNAFRRSYCRLIC